MVEGEDGGDLVGGEAVLAEVAAAAAAVEECLVAGAEHAVRVLFVEVGLRVGARFRAGLRDGRRAAARGSSLCVG
ncbi:hypothetical protein GCM10009850_087730 [Nonomuraea monospora]|uniref:Uncharacterized protein n=1 Tax=Nonomuraea monospora TaxID=568818 RepID=A0ABP5PNQ7_9ACTN